MWNKKKIGFLLAIVFLSWINVLIFSIYKVQSYSMMPILEAGNYIFVSNFFYKIPKYYPLVNIQIPFFYKYFNYVNRNDLIVFKSPLPRDKYSTKKNNKYVKRAVGLPGDTLLVGKNRLQMKRDPSEISLQQLGDTIITTTTIPNKGDQIKLLNATFRVWEKIINQDGNELKIDSRGSFWINNVKKDIYRVRQNYYFLQGDNTRFSNDSRNWGLVPEQDLIGRVEFILWPLPIKTVNINP